MGEQGERPDPLGGRPGARHSKARHTRRLVAPLIALGAALGVASIAWACMYQPRPAGLSVDNGPPGATVVVTGNGPPAGGPAAIHWDSPEGPLLATAVPDSVGSYSASVRVPDVAQDVHYVVVVQGGVTTRTGFEVTAPAVAVRSAPLPAGAQANTAWARPSVAPPVIAPPESGVGQRLVGGVVVAACVTLIGAALVGLRRRRNRDRALTWSGATVPR